MSTFDKIKQRIIGTPTPNDITPTELQNFLEHCPGFKCVSKKGSHYSYKFKDNDFLITIPMHSPIKRPYIRMIRDVLVEDEGE